MENITRDLELRAEGRTIRGIAISYRDYSPSHRERFVPGSVALEQVVNFNLQHDPHKTIAYHPNGGLALEATDQGLEIRAEVPPTPAGDYALDLVQSGKASGLSIEFRALEDRQANGIREIVKAVVSGVGLVRSPSYPQSKVELRKQNERLYWRLV